jgi:hypothetical protein
MAKTRMKKENIGRSKPSDGNTKDGDSNHIMVILLADTTFHQLSVISLDKFMRDNRNIVKFQQVSTIQGTEHMIFDADDQ